MVPLHKDTSIRLRLEGLEGRAIFCFRGLVEEYSTRPSSQKITKGAGEAIMKQNEGPQFHRLNPRLGTHCKLWSGPGRSACRTLGGAGAKEAKEFRTRRSSTA